jgi:hypothetical protein
MQSHNKKTLIGTPYPNQKNSPTTSKNPSPKHKTTQTQNPCAKKAT